MEEGPMSVSRLRPMVHVICVILLMTIPVMRGVFDTVSADITRDHYAERPWPVNEIWEGLVPTMPANTLVNIGYVLVGLYWLLATKILAKAQTRRGDLASTHVTGHDAYMMYTLCWLSILYAPVQTARLLLMTQRLAVMDQWYTLPGMAWGVVWAQYHLHGWSPARILIVISCSTASYTLALIHPLGFDVALAIHLIFIVWYLWKVQTQYGTTSSRTALVKALCGTSAFVCLKLLDHHLAESHEFFQYLSGHFWSKIGDVAQIYYAAEFFFIITLERARTHDKDK